MADNIRISIMKNVIKNYAWGSKTAIPDLLGVPNTENQPQAEMWMGAHPSSPSQIRYGQTTASLLDLIKQNPLGILGPKTAEKFSNKLPFLFKVLASAAPLSIQAHPNLDQARKGFRSENDQEIPLDAFNRSYKDDNHKPEVICALTPFWALRGFRKLDSIVSLLKQVHSNEIRTEAKTLSEKADREGLKSFYSGLMSMDNQRKQRLVKEVVTYAENHKSDDSIFGWIVKLGELYPADIGVLSPILLNLINLKPGQALFLDAGELHAYLEGTGVELMANSDNVLRGGCTPKFMNIKELLHVLTFQTGDAVIIEPEGVSPAESVYKTPTDEFRLSVVRVDDKTLYEKQNNQAMEVLLCVEGKAAITDKKTNERISLHKGVSIMIPALVRHYTIEGKAKFYKASVPE